jgi:hypothetical protein
MFADNLDPVREGTYGKLPFVYLAYMAPGMPWFLLPRRKAARAAR